MILMHKFHQTCEVDPNFVSLSPAIQTLSTQHKILILLANLGKTYIAFSFIYIARAFSQKKQYNKAIEYYEKAIKIGQVNNYPTILASAMNETSFLFLKTGENKKALQYAKDCIKIKKTDQRIFSLGDTYRYLKMYDSAYFYLNQACLSPNIHTARSAYQALYILVKKKKITKRQ